MLRPTLGRGQLDVAKACRADPIDGFLDAVTVITVRIDGNDVFHGFKTSQSFPHLGVG
jgi:hypothetical protein